MLRRPSRAFRSSRTSLRVSLALCAGLCAGLGAGLFQPPAAFAQAAASSASPASPGPQAPAAAPARAAEARLEVAGDVKTPLMLSAADLAAMPRTKAESRDEGRTVTYEGVPVAEVLKRAGVPLGAELRGDALATYVLAHASDGYQVLFSLAELDPGFTQNDIIIADTIDGKPLFAYQGPLRIVAPRDARGARSIRMLQRIEVVRLKKK